MQLVTFHIGPQLYGLDIQRVQEVIIPEHITEIPNLPDFIEGILDLRGTVFPIVDMRKRFRTPDPAGKGRVLITEIGGSTLGLRVDSVGRVASVEDSGFRPSPKMITGLGADFVAGVFERPGGAGNGLIVVLDLDRLLSETESAAIREIR